uniref:Uncharacterized protein n=1 Tax=Anguilla anguilla TaxID=7936 RepID=A0A0E9T362_ANGAN
MELIIVLLRQQLSTRWQQFVTSGLFRNQSGPVSKTS